MERLLAWPTVQADNSTRREIIGWWESRRFRFNLYVGCVGIATGLAVLIAGSAAVKPGVDFGEPLAMIVGPFFYGIVANVCYTAGWIVDLMLYRGKARVSLYKFGVIFSVALTALPGVWAVAAWLYTLISGHKLD